MEEQDRQDHQELTVECQIHRSFFSNWETTCHQPSPFKTISLQKHMYRAFCPANQCILREYATTINDSLHDNSIGDNRPRTAGTVLEFWALSWLGQNTYNVLQLATHTLASIASFQTYHSTNVLELLCHSLF